MESPTPLAHEELLELAALDALGLLDEYEAALFTRSFHRASASVQKQVVDMQAELASDTSLLPAEEPSPELRARVLDAVANAVETQTEELAPIASIGRQDRYVEPVFTMPRQQRMYGWFLRAAVFALIAALAVVCYFFADAYNTSNKLAQLAISENTRQQLEELIGPTLQEFASNPSCRVITLASTGSERNGSATLYIDDETQQAYLVTFSLPQSASSFALNAQTADGGMQRIHSFNNDGRIIGVRVDNLSRALLASAAWEITDNQGTVILRSA